MSKLYIIIPALNEEGSINKVIADIPVSDKKSVIVVNNRSTDNTENVAIKAGATVLNETKPGYGNACLKGIEYLKNLEYEPEIVVFLDGDYSDYPEEMISLVKPIQDDTCDFVIGSRILGKRERGSLTPQQIYGNWLATRLLWLFYGKKFTDLGPFRAIRWKSLLELNMCDQNYGWTIEMQIKAIKKQLRIEEIPVKYRKRIGVSKVSGTIKGTIFAGVKIIYTIFKYL